MEVMTRNGIRVIFVLGALALSACSSAPKKASCPLADGASCLSAPEVYARTNFADSVTTLPPPDVPVTEVRETVATAPAAARTSPVGPVGPVAYRPYEYAKLETAGDSLVVTATSVRPTPAVAPSAAPARAVQTSPQRATTEPNREPARVMKIRIGAWEDENGSLHGRSDVFTEIEPRRWTVGTRAVQTSPGFALLEGFGQGAAQDAQPAAGAAAAGSRPGE